MHSMVEYLGWDPGSSDTASCTEMFEKGTVNLRCGLLQYLEVLFGMLRLSPGECVFCSKLRQHVDSGSPDSYHLRRFLGVHGCSADSCTTV